MLRALLALMFAVLMQPNAWAQDQSNAIAHYANGLQAAAERRLADAEAAFVQAVQFDDEVADYHLSLAVVRILQENDTAETALERASRLAEREPALKVWRFANNTLFKPFGEYPMSPPYEVRLPYTEDVIETMFLFGTLDVPNDREAARARFPELATAFAQHQMTKPAVWPHMLGQASAHFNEADYDGAWAIIEAIRSGGPDDVRLLYLSASCRLFFGDYGAARDEYTAVLQQQPDYAYALLGRARAAAKMGDAERAREDFEAAAAIDPGSAEAYRDAVMPLIEVLGDEPEAIDIHGVMAALNSAAAQSAPLEQLIEMARPVILARRDLNWNRDEVYAERVGALKLAIQTTPNDAGPLVELAWFYLRPLAQREVVDAQGAKRQAWLPLRNEWREPGGKTIYAVPWVFRGDPDAARPLLDQALRIDSNHHQAIRGYAMLLRMKHDLDRMQPFVERALAIDPVDLDMARLYLDYQTAKARVQNNQAAALRTPSVHYEERADGRYRITTYPSGADYASARAFDNDAQDSRRFAVKPLETVAKATKNDPSRKAAYDLTNAVYYHWIGDLERSGGAINAVLNVDPYNFDALEMMIDLATGTHTTELRNKWQGWLDSLIGTSARVRLDPVFGLIQETRYRSALEQLAQAEQLDPGSSLLYAYRSVAYAGQGDGPSARQAALVTMALEGARSGIAGRSLLPSATGTLDADEAGLSLLMRTTLARFAPSPADGIELLTASRAIAERVPAVAWDDEIETTDMPGTRKGGRSVRDIVIEQLALSVQLYDQLGDRSTADQQRQQATMMREAQQQAEFKRQRDKFTRGE